MALPDQIYYNARLTNYVTATSFYSPLLCDFTDNRSIPIIEKASDFEMSVIRLSATTSELPSLCVEHPVQTGSQPANTDYIFNLTNGVWDVSGSVQWVNPSPVLNQTTGDTFSDPYWSLPNGQFLYFNNLVNTCLSTLTANAISSGKIPSSTAAPWFSFNSSTGVFTFNIPEYYYQNNLYWEANDAARNLFRGFSETLQGDGYYRYNIYPVNATLANSVYSLSQIPGNLVNWNPVRRLTLTTRTLPALQEAITPTTNPLNGLPLNANTSEAIICDFTPSLATGLEFSDGSTFEYSPTAEYRFASLIGNNPIANIQVELSWEDPLGTLHKYLLGYNGFMSAKILFRRRHAPPQSQLLPQFAAAAAGRR